jgi:acyl carrier protein
MEVQNTAIEQLSAADIQDWIVNYLTELLEIEAEEIDVTVSFDRYGLDSSAAVGLMGDLENWLETEIDPTIMYDYPTVESLSEHLSAQLKVGNNP